MHRFTRRSFPAATAGAVAHSATADPVAPWKNAATRPVSTIPDRHTIHTYFNVSPETMDGRYVLYYTSVTPEAQSGEIRRMPPSTWQR